MRQTVRDLHRLGLPVVLAAACLLFCAAPAHAGSATRFADPAGEGTACTQTQPCSITTAVQDAPDGAEVALLEGDYTLPLDFVIDRGIDVSPASEEGPVSLSGGSLGTPAVSGPGSSLSHVELSGLSGVAIFEGALVEQVVATGGFGCIVRDGLLRDSVCLGYDDAGVLAIAAGDQIEAVVRNVTAVGEDGAVLRSDRGSQLSFDARNSIFLTTLPDDARYVDLRLLRGDGAALETDIDFSNFRSSAGDGIDPLEPGTRSNQAAAPVFRDAPGGDFRQAQGSPTLDSGTAGANGIGSLDFEGDERVQGREIDIGADESAFGDAAPTVRIVRAPDKRTRNRRPGFRFRGSDDVTSPNELRFRCGLNTRNLTPCSSPRIYRNLDPGRYRFKVEAIDEAGNRSRPAAYSWRIVKR
ncbi:hypothetical protein HJD18_07315 [Thermoleophilia bacterium SCSIO 60948]|nr:hypothetical protein HJD18_07315 [Thermoleophilia bacterium SCSIO 60948]